MFKKSFQLANQKLSGIAKKISVQQTILYYYIWVVKLYLILFFWGRQLSKVENHWFKLFKKSFHLGVVH